MEFEDGLMRENSQKGGKTEGRISREKGVNEVAGGREEKGSRERMKSEKRWDRFGIVRGKGWG